MSILVFFLAASVAGIGVAFLVPGWSDLLLIAGPSALASLYLLLRRTRPAPDLDLVVLDGSNVMYWKDGIPQLEPVREVLQLLTDRGYAPGVFFDANAGYLLLGRYLHDKELSKLLNIKKNHVMVVPKGTPADPHILTAARDMGAQIVTNDRFRDWAGDFPEIATKGHLIKGGYRSGQVWLDLEERRQLDIS